MGHHHVGWPPAVMQRPNGRRGRTDFDVNDFEAELEGGGALLNPYGGLSKDTRIHYDFLAKIYQVQALARIKAVRDSCTP
jgi:hypothetical protein